MENYELLKDPTTYFYLCEESESFPIRCKIVPNQYKTKIQPVPLNKVIVGSDGMGAQCHPRFSFMLLSKFDLIKPLEWYYNEPHHVKGMKDGAGGTVKNFVFRVVKSEKISFKTPEEFNNAANILIITTSLSSIYLLIPEMLVEPPEVANAQPIPETL